MRSAKADSVPAICSAIVTAASLPDRVISARIASRSEIRCPVFRPSVLPRCDAAWIEAEAGQDGDDHIPYRQEAALFANIYWSNRRRYEAEFAAASSTNQGVSS